MKTAAKILYDNPAFFWNDGTFIGFAMWDNKELGYFGLELCYDSKRVWYYVPKHPALFQHALRSACVYLVEELFQRDC